MSSNSFSNIGTLKEYCANPSDTLKDKEDFMVLESTSTSINISNFNADDTKCPSMRKSSAFQKKHETPTHNVSHMFENILQDDSQLHCTSPSDNVKDKEDSSVLESTSTGVNISDFNADDTKCLSMHRRSVFQKNKAYTYNVSHMFENILQDDSEMEISQDSIRLSNFQNRKRTLPSSDDNFDEIIKSDDSEMDSTKVSTKTPKLWFSKKNKDQSYCDVPDYNLSTTDDISIIDDVNDSKIKEIAVFKKPSQLVNDCSTNIMNESKTETLTNRFTKKSTIVDGSVFDNIINVLSTSHSVSNDKTTSLNSTYAVPNSNRMSLCGTIEMPSLNHTYDIPVNSTSTETGLLSESGKNNIELKNISIKQPINETYTLENDQTSNKSTFDMSRNSENAKNTLSDTYTIENNFYETQPKSANKTINTLADMSNIYDQSKSSLQKPNFIRKLPLNIGSQDYNITINDSNNSTVIDDMDKTENNKSTKFKLRKNYYEGDSEIFDNIITSSQENEVPTSENTNNDVISNTTNTSIRTSNNDLFDISSESKSKEDTDKSMNKLLTQQSSVSQYEVLKNDKNISNIPFSHTFSISKQNMEESVNTTSTQTSNVLRGGIFENYKNISEIPLADKFNISNSFKRSYKFNFNKNFGRLSISNQEYSMNLDTNGEKTNILNKSANYLNFDFGCNSQISKIQEEKHTDSQITQQLSVSSPSVINALSHGVEKSSHDLASTQNTTFTLSQSPGLRFTGNHNVNAHSAVFSDLIENSVNIDTSVNISKLMKFKSHKNLSESNSIMFENVITNSQESNTTSTKNATLIHSVLYDQSKVQSDEISIFANMDEILSDSESLTNSDHLKTRDTDDTLSLKESNCSEVDLNVLNNTSNNFNLAYSETKTFNGNDTNVSTSEISENGNKTCNEQTISLESEESLSNHSLSNITAGLLENNSSPSICHLTSSTSKCALASFNTDIHVSNKTDNQTNTFVSSDTKNHFINTPEHSLYSIYNNEILTINERDVSKRNQLKRSISSKCSTSSTSQNENITLNTIGSLDSYRSPTNPSKRSRCSTLVDNIESLDASIRSINESIKSTSNSSLTNNTRNSSNISSNSSMQEDDTNNGSRISTHSLKEKNCSSDIVEPEISDYTDKLLNNDELTLNNTAGSLEQKEVSTKKSVSKSSLTGNTRNSSSISSNSSIQEDDTNNGSRISTRSSKEKSCSSDIVKPEISDYTDKLLNNDELTLNNAAGSLEQKEVSTKKSVSKSSLTGNTRNSSSISSKLSIQEDDTNNVSRISTRLSKEKSCSSDIVKPEISNYNTDGLQDKNKFTNSRVTRLSSSLKKTLKNNELMLLKVNANLMSMRSSRCSKSSFNSNNKSDNSQSDDSIFWTTLSDDSRSKSTTQNFCAIEFQTPTNNRLAVAEHIANKIGIMSVNRQKTTHPGAFVLEDNISRPLTRSSVRHADGSPSILTKLLAGGNNTSKSMTSSQSFTETIVDQSQVKNKVKVKFTTLYKKELWITNRLYNFLVDKLNPKYNIYSIKYAEKFVKYLASILQNVHTAKVDRQLYSDMLRYHMARYGIINDTFDYLGFLTNYIPKPYYDELIPGWQLATSEVKFNPNKYFVAIMKDEEFLNQVLEYLDAT